MIFVKKRNNKTFGLQDPWFLFNIFVYTSAKSLQHCFALQVDPLIPNFFRDFPFIAIAITSLWFLTNKILKIENSLRPSEVEIVSWTIFWSFLLEYALPGSLGVGTCDKWDVFAYFCNALLTICVWRIYYKR
jgi:hypothetical protein